MSQSFDDGQCDRMIGPAESNGASGGEHHFWHNLGCLENKGVGPGQVGTQELENRLVDPLDVFLDLGLVGADQGQGFLRVHLFDQMQTLHRFLAEYTTAQTINGVGGIDDHPILVQDGNHLFDQTRLGIVRIDTNEHGFV